MAQQDLLGNHASILNEETMSQHNFVCIGPNVPHYES